MSELFVNKLTEPYTNNISFICTWPTAKIIFIEDAEKVIFVRSVCDRYNRHLKGER